MTIVARFKNPTDAAFFQSLLQSEGITATVVDSGAALTFSEDIRVEVEDTDAIRASELKARYEKEGHERAELVEATHPATGIPFFALWFFTAVAAFVILDGFQAYTMFEQDSTIAWSDPATLAGLMWLFVATPLVISLGSAIAIFLVWLCCRIVMRRRGHGS